MPDHRTRVVWDEELTGYDFGPGHPMSPVRLVLTIELARALGVLDAPGVEVVPAPVPGTDDLVLTAHDAGDEVLRAIEAGAVGYLLKDAPPSALRDQAEGTTIVQVTWTADGTITNASVRKSAGNRDLDRAAVSAVRNWKVCPGDPGTAVVPVTWSLQ